MSLDDDLRAYERALLRSGQDPRAVALRILGVDRPDRFVLLFQRLRGVTEETDLLSLVSKSRKVTGQHYGLQPHSEHLYALPVVTLEDAVKAQEILAGRATSWLWDQRLGVQHEFGNETARVFSKIEEDWIRLPWERLASPVEVRPFGDPPLPR